MDAFGTLMGGESAFSTSFPDGFNQAEQQQTHQYPHQLPSMMESANNTQQSFIDIGKRHSRYHQFSSPGHKHKPRFLSLRRNRSKDDDGEATEPMIAHQSSYTIPSDEDDGEYDHGGNHRQQEQYQMQSKGSQAVAGAQAHNNTRGSRIRRMQKRFLA
jgi:hypothetical protein